MALRGIKPSNIEKRLKMFVYGSAGSGKTTCAIQFPAPYVIDTEKGAENDIYSKIIEKNQGVIFQTNDFDEILQEVKSLLSEKHEFKTLIIDPFTTIYNDLVEKSGNKYGTEFGRHYNEANKKVKQLINLLLRLDMNVIITSHSKNEYGEGMKVIGQTFDCYKKLDYLFDLVLETQKRIKERFALVRKTRMENFKEGELFPFSYDTIADKYGRSIIERDSIAEKLASPEQIKEILNLVDLLKIPQDITEKWLEKGNAMVFSEMRDNDIQKCIDHLKSKIKG